jgi:hypothetical protein
VAEYASGGLENQIFASKYTFYIPDKKQLIGQIEAILEQDSQKALKSLNKNITSKSELWKAPVKARLREIGAKRVK